MCSPNWAKRFLVSAAHQGFLIRNMLSQVYTYVIPQLPGLGEVCKLNKLPKQDLALAEMEQAEAETSVRAQRRKPSEEAWSEDRGESTAQPLTSTPCSETPFQHRRSQKPEEADINNLWLRHYEYKATRNSAQWPRKGVMSIHLPFNMWRQTRHLKYLPWSRSRLLFPSAL